MMNSDPLQCLIAVIVMHLKIMDRERARKKGYDHTTAGYSPAQYGPVHTLFSYER